MKTWLACLRKRRFVCCKIYEYTACHKVKYIIHEKYVRNRSKRCLMVLLVGTVVRMNIGADI